MTHSGRAANHLFDHTVDGTSIEAEGLGGLEVDHKKTGRLHHRQVDQLLALEKEAGVDAGLTPLSPT